MPWLFLLLLLQGRLHLLQGWGGEGARLAVASPQDISIKLSRKYRAFWKDESGCKPRVTQGKEVFPLCRFVIL